MTRLDDITRRAEAATPGPWGNYYSRYGEDGEVPDWVVMTEEEEPRGRAAYIADTITRTADAYFIAQARDDIPWLVERVSELVFSLDFHNLDEESGERIECLEGCIACTALAKVGVVRG